MLIPLLCNRAEGGAMRVGRVDRRTYEVMRTACEVAGADVPDAAALTELLGRASCTAEVYRAALALLPDASSPRSDRARRLLEAASSNRSFVEPIGTEMQSVLAAERHLRTLGPDSAVRHLVARDPRLMHLEQRLQKEIEVKSGIEAGRAAVRIVSEASSIIGPRSGASDFYLSSPFAEKIFADHLLALAKRHGVHLPGG